MNAKECSSDTGCFFQEKYKYLDNYYSGNWDTNTAHKKLILQDGVQVNFTSFTKNCNLDNSNNTGSTNVCGYIHVDVNGVKKPNVIGKDSFVFVLKNEGLYPSGCDIVNLCTKEYSGYACACKVLREGAMNY